jgi:hypothetical protein
VLDVHGLNDTALNAAGLSGTVGLARKKDLTLVTGAWQPDFVQQDAGRSGDVDDEVVVGDALAAGTLRTRRTAKSAKHSSLRALRPLRS